MHFSTKKGQEKEKADDAPLAEAKSVEVQGRVHRELFRSADGTYAIVSLSLPEGRKLTIKGTFGKFDKGDVITVTGPVVMNQKYGGYEMTVERIAHDIPTSLDGIAAFLAKKVFGIGKALAAKLVAEFGTDVVDILDNHPDRLLSVRGITKERADRLVEVWAADKNKREATIFLYAHGVPANCHSLAISALGDDLVRTVTNNPYILTNVPGIGFITADAVARKLGISKSDPRRMLAGISHTLEEAAKDGHCALPITDLVQQAMELLEVDVDAVTDGIDSAVAIGDVVAHDVTYAEGDEAMFQLRSLAKAEEYVAAKLLRLNAMSSDGKTAQEVPEHIGLVELSDEQRAAAASAGSRGCTVITGGPGTGKTTIIRAIIEANITSSTITLCAPTGRAAKRMEEATGKPASTVHRLIGYTAATVGATDADASDMHIEGDLVIVDEASMLDVYLLARLLGRLAPKARLVLVGDKDQLPSIGPGSVLSDIITAGTVPVYRLNTIYRQAQRSMIVTNAHKVNNGEFPAIRPGPDQKADMTFFLAENHDEVIQNILGTIRELSARGLSAKSDIQVMSPMRKGDIGVDSLNKVLQEALNPAGPVLAKLPYMDLRQGDKVVHTKNNYDLNVFNGDVGYILGLTKKSGAAVAELDEDSDEEVLLQVSYPDRGVICYPPAYVKQLKLAYAMTVHKCQGSEMPAVIAVIHKSHYIMLARNLLYTAITRGKSHVHIVGTTSGIGRSVSNDAANNRCTLLVERLTGMIATGSK